MRIEQAGDFTIQGFVVNNKDPLGVGRVRFKSHYFENTVHGRWAIPIFPFVGNGFGFFAVPKIDELIDITFVKGDIQQPRYAPTFYNKRRAAPAESGATDDDPSLKMVLGNISGYVIFDEDSNEVRVAHRGSDAIVTLADGKVTVSADNVTLDASGTKIEVKSGIITLAGGGTPAAGVDHMVEIPGAQAGGVTLIGRIISGSGQVQVDR